MVSVVKIFLDAPGRFFEPKKQKSKTYFPIKRPGRFFEKLRYATGRDKIHLQYVFIWDYISDYTYRPLRTVQK